MPDTIRAQGDRQDYIDIAKGLGMITIIWGHIRLGGMSNLIVYSFHIPLFFFLSGLVFSPKRYASFGVFLNKRFKGLLIPYYIFSFITWIIWAVYSYLTHAQVESFWMPLFQTFLAQGSEGYLIHNVPLWFVMCLFSVEMVYFFVSKLNDWFNLLVCIVLCVIGVLSTQASFFDFSTLPWSIDVALMALPFYASGSLLSKHFPHSKQVSTILSHKVLSTFLFVLMAILVYFGAKYNGRVSMGHANLGHNPFVFYGTAYCGIASFMILCIFISRISLGLVASLKWIGRNSFRFMAVHNPIKGFVIVILAKLLHSSTSAVSNSELKSLIAFGITLVVTIVVVLLIAWALKKVFGRNSLAK